MTHTFEAHAVEPPLARLERSLIDEFVRAQGFDPLKLSDLPAEKRETLLRDASVFASSKLAEVESRSHFLDEIHGGPDGNRTGL
jgi:hypothetical protein